MERHSTRRRHRLVKAFFIGTMLSAFLASCVGGVVPVGPGNGLPQFGELSGPGNAVTSSPRTQIKFQSDQSVILDHPGEQYQLRASTAGGNTVSYISRDPAIATVDASGLITANRSGVATIIASTRGDAATVTAVIGQSGPNTVAIPSESVVYADEGRAVLLRTSKTSRLRLSEIVISGDRGGLFGRIMGIATTPRNVVLKLAKATIPDAFPNMDAHIIGAAQHVKLELRHGQATLRYDDGTTFSSNEGLKCTGSAGATITGPSFSFDLTANPLTELVTRGGKTKVFDLSLNLDATGSGSTGDLSTAAKGAFSCTVSLGSIRIPIEHFLVLIFYFKAEPTFGFAGSITRSGNLVGPTFDYRYKGPQGIEYDDGNWSQVDSGAPKATSTMNDQTQAPTGATKLSAKVFLDAEFSIAAKLAGEKNDLVKFTFFDLQPYLGLDFELSSPISYTKEGYTGPTWSTDAGVEALFDLKLDGDIQELLKYLKISSINLQVTDWKPSPIPLAGSPTISESADARDGCNVALKATITDDHSFPIDYSGDAVNFETVAGPNAPQNVASGNAQGDATKSVATADWEPNPKPPPAYRLLALLEDPVFSRVGLPYASGAQQVDCSSPSPSPSPTPSGPQIVSVSPATVTEYYGFSALSWQLVKTKGLPRPQGSDWWSKGLPLAYNTCGKKAWHFECPKGDPYNDACNNAEGATVPWQEYPSGDNEYVLFWDFEGTHGYGSEYSYSCNSEVFVGTDNGLITHKPLRGTNFLPVTLEIIYGSSATPPPPPSPPPSIAPSICLYEDGPSCEGSMQSLPESPRSVGP